MIAAGGIVLVPDHTRACRCAYQNQASIALIQHGVRPPNIVPQGTRANFRFDRRTRESLFVGRLVIAMNHQLADVEIRHTLDDGHPTIDSPPYTGPITITETTTVRAAAFRGARKLADRDAIVFKRVENLGSARSR